MILVRSGVGKLAKCLRVGVVRLLMLAAVSFLATGSLCHAPEPSFEIENISNNASFSQSPCITCTKDGHVVIAWSDSASGQENVWLVEKASPGSEWTAPFNVSKASEPSRDPSTAFGPDGTLHLAWSQFVARGEVGGWVIVCQSRIGSQWTVAETISRGVSARPRLAVDGAGRLHLLFWNLSSDEVCYSSKAPESSWAQVQVLDKAYFEGQLAVDAAGRCYAAWNVDADSLADFLCYSVKPVDGLWASSKFVSGRGLMQSLPALACGDSNCYLGFSTLVAGSGLGLMRYKWGTGWSDLDTSCPSRTVNPLGLTIDADGCPVAVWGGVPAGLRVARKSGGWDVVTVSDTLNPFSRCCAAADGLGNIHVVWDSRGTLYTARPDVYYACIKWKK